MIVEEIIYLAMLSHVLVSGVSLSDDPKVTCPSFQFKEDKSVTNCVYPSSDATINYVQPCADGYVCTFKSSNSYTCEAEPTPVGYPGDDCSGKGGDFCPVRIYRPDTRQCRCTGTEGECTEGQQCAIGLFCSSGNCIDLLGELSACSSDYQCQYGNFCYIREGASSGVCTELFSLATGTKLAKCTDELIGFECQSGYCKEETDDTGKTTYQCAEISKLDNPDDACEYDTDCVGHTVDSKTQVHSTCSCGYNNNGNAYCELLPGDDSYAAYRDLTMKWVNIYRGSRCYTERRYSIDCLKIYEDYQLYYEVMYYYYKTKYWSKIKNVETEVQKVLTPDYWTAEEEYTQLGCDAFVEKLTSQTFDKDTCVFYDSEEEKNYVQACDELSTCNPPETLPGNYTCKADEVQKSYPGEQCKTDSDCMYGSCGSDLKCAGKSENEACSDTLECAPGYYCNTKCTTLMSGISAYGCKEDSDCDYDMFCYIQAHSSLNECYTIFSFKSGFSIEWLDSNLVSLGCSSGFVLDTYDSDGFKDTICADPYTVENINKPCSSKIDCIAYNADKTDYTFSECSCGYSQAGDSYCELLQGNDAYSQYVVYLKQWLKSNLAKKLQ
jgi:hypothetical protein